MIMFGPSLKSVPGCLVSIVPMLIGVPVALTPGFGPHFDVSTVPLELLVAALLLVALLLLGAAAPLLELELELPQPASTSKPSTVASARSQRARTEWWYILTLSSPQ
jgi:hypothetical protein